MKNFIMFIIIINSFLGFTQIPAISTPGFKAKAGTTSGDAVWTTAGTYSWTVPAGVTSICAVCIGGGGGAGVGYDPDGGVYFGASGGGGGLGYLNNISVTPGESLTIIVGAGGNAGTFSGYTQVVCQTNGGDSSLKRGSTTLLLGGKGYTNEQGCVISSSYWGGNGGNHTGNGGDGGYGDGAANVGNSGLYTGTGGQTGNSLPNGKGSSLYGSSFAQSTSYPGGGGFGAWISSDYYDRGGYPGKAGGVRVLWGAGRAFPNTNVSTSTN